MKISCEIDIRHLTRVEGHGNIRLSIKEGKVHEARWEIVETPRFFEAILVGKQYENAPYLCGRICGICSIGHTLASIRAIERAFQFTPSRQTEKLRLLLKHMETLQSHILHLYFLAAPDFFAVDSFLPLLESHPEMVQQGLRLKMLANDLCDEVGGRRMHPTRTVVGGFTMLPEKSTLELFQGRLRRSVADLKASVELFSRLAVPQFERKTEYVSLRGEGSYPFIGGNLMSSDGVEKKEDEYRAMTNEYMADYSTSKLSRLSRDSLAVGALARVNNNMSRLRPQAFEIAEDLGFGPINYNPYMNSLAQLVECVHVVHDAASLIGELLDEPWEEPRLPVRPREGVGIAAVEVPRGILYHCLEFDAEGRIRKADCVIPTSQNHANIYHDIEKLAADCAKQGKSEEETRLLAEMLVRSYDPCISCSVH